jgi:hypothetical protein
MMELRITPFLDNQKNLWSRTDCRGSTALMKIEWRHGRSAFLFIPVLNISIRDKIWYDRRI